MTYIITRSIVEIDDYQIESMYVLKKVTDIDVRTGEVNKTSTIMASKKRGDCVKYRKSLTGGK